MWTWLIMAGALWFVITLLSAKKSLDPIASMIFVCGLFETTLYIYTIVKFSL
jgi:hypothetical protein